MFEEGCAYNVGRERLGWTTFSLTSIGENFVNTLTNTLWYLDGHFRALIDSVMFLVILKFLMDITTLNKASTGERMPPILVQPLWIHILLL